MQHLHVDQVRRTGGAAIAAGALLFAGVAPELVVQAQEPDGTVTRPALWALYVILWTLGSAMLVLAVRGLRRLSGPDASRRRRSGRAGYRISIAGAVLLAAFGGVALVTGLVSGKPLEAAFLLFALGLLLLVVGQVLVGTTLRRSGAVGAWWVALPVASLGVLVGVAIPADPWHDLGLFTFDAAWAALGARLLIGFGARHRGLSLQPVVPDRSLA